MGTVVAAALVIAVDAVWMFPDRLPAWALPLYVVAIGLVFGLRERTGTGALAAALTLSAASGGSYALLVWAGFHAGHRVASSRAGAAVALAGALAYGTARVAESGAPPTAVAAECVVLLALPMAVGAYLAQHRRLVATLDDRNRRLRRERELLAERERLHERLRIARDVHDSLGHRLGLVSIQAAALEAGGLSEAQHKEALRQLADASRRAVDELHDLVGALRSPDEPLTRTRGVTDIPALVEDFRTSGVEVTLTERGTPGQVSAPAGEAAYRVVEEGLTNAAKHAPGHPVTVTLEWEPGALLLSVGNPRPITAANAPGHDLADPTERIALAGTPHPAEVANGTRHDPAGRGDLVGDASPSGTAVAADHARPGCPEQGGPTRGTVPAEAAEGAGDDVAGRAELSDLAGDPRSLRMAESAGHGGTGCAEQADPVGAARAAGGGGHGLAGLAERVGLVGGVLNVEDSEAGFRLRALIPAEQPAEPEPVPGTGALHRYRFAALVLAAAALLAAIGPVGAGHS
ncbi:sensor histidine kinase [Thermomonospora cellulosilytica]|uniref:histidine kinase n=1 Tax=Thermomonospora cellulosilytica TaxID=1411118 RepID=A0A7W3N2V7_9ACTN|nr:histidine kinase [Thermomonospora cellulosilytica]MBA9006566.1 signal transduction histidine kinase [Thermomonospora cellulosilytica]